MDGIMLDGLIVIVIAGLSVVLGGVIARIVSLAVAAPLQPNSERGHLMSNEDRDEMVEDQPSDEELDVEDYEVEETAKPELGGDRLQGAGGSSAVIWVIIIVVIAALIVVGWFQWQGYLQKQAQEAREARERTRERQLREVAGDIPEAEAALDQGNVDEMLRTLRGIHEKLQIIRTSAAQAGDTEAAQRVKKMRDSVEGLINDIGPEYQKLQDQIEELRQRAKQEMQGVHKAFAGYRTAPAAGAGAETGAPGDEETAGTEPEEPAAEGEEPAEAEAGVEEPEAAAEEPTEETPEAEASDQPAEEAPQEPPGEGAEPGRPQPEEPAA
ncbi:MAG: hypothetical protein ACP5KN_09230 [Armatimonadota bacterium]